MPTPRQTPASEAPHLSHEDILAREQAAVRRRRLRRGLLALAVLALTVGIVFGARPTLHVTKAWQARRLAAQARQFVDAGKWTEAKDKITDANTIWPTEPEVARATAIFLSRVGNPRQAITYWKRLAELTPLTADDRRESAAAELGVGDLDAAEAHLRQAWPAGTTGTLADWQLAMQLAVRRPDAAQAATLARRILSAPKVSDRERLTAAGILINTDPGPEAQTSGWQTVAAVAAGDKSLESLDALLAMVRFVATLPAGAPRPEPIPPLDTLAARIDAHPLAKIPQHLLVLDLRAAQDPAHRTDLVQFAIDRYGGSRDDVELATLTGWLYGKRDFEKVLTLLPLERAAGDRTLFLQRLDALGALNRWQEIRETIQAGKFPLEPMLAQMYLARCADQLGEPKVRDACWEAALDAAGTDPAKLLQIGEYAERNNVAATADKAFRAAVAAAPDSHETNESLFRWLETNGQTRELYAALTAYATRVPADRALRNDLAYFDALLGQNVTAARDTARALVEAAPHSLPHRTTLALAELRLHNALAALDAFKSVNLPDPAALPARSRAVCGAVLWQASYEREARAMVQGLPPGQLLPEERELIRSITGAPTP